MRPRDAAKRRSGAASETPPRGNPAWFRVSLQPCFQVSCTDSPSSIQGLHGIHPPPGQSPQRDAPARCDGRTKPAAAIAQGSPAIRSQFGARSGMGQASSPRMVVPRPHAQGTPATQGFRTIRAWGRPVRHGLRAAGPNRLEARIHVPSAYDPQRCRTALSGRRCSCGGGGRGMARDPFPHAT